MQIPFSPPDISDAEIDAVSAALRSGWITTGPRTKEFEKKIAVFCGTEKAVCFNSATAALEMIFRLIGVGKDDEIITSAYTYTASASPVIHVGATLKLVDTAKDSYEFDYNALENSITEKTKIIVPVDIGGVVCDYERIFDIVRRKRELFHTSNSIQKAFGRIIIVADCAHAFGARKNGLYTGNIADFSSFSFHAVKNLTTAEGGAAVWRNIPGISNDDIYNRFQIFSLHGQSKDALAKTKPGAWEYDIIEPAYKCNMTDILASVGLKQLERYSGMLERRHEIIEKYDNAFRPMGIDTLRHICDNQISSGHLYLTRIPGINEKQRNDIIVKMAEHGIACNVHYKPLPMMTAYRNLGFDIKNYSNAYNQYKNEITLPLHTLLTDEEVDYIIKNYIMILKEYIK